MSVSAWFGKALSNRLAPIKPWIKLKADIEVDEGLDGAPKAVIRRGPLAGAHAALTGGVERLIDLTPKGGIDVNKLKTLHEDGGVAAFEAAAQAAAVDAEEIPAIAANFRFFGKTKAVIGAVIGLLGILALAAFGDFYSFGALLMVAVVFAIASAADHYRAWQFDQRRFGSLTEWVQAWGDMKQNT